MTTTDTPRRNGVDTATLFATLDAVKADPDLARFQFRARNRWVNGTHSRSTIHGFYGTGQELTHRRASSIDADHPEVLVGQDNAPTPAEHLLHALAACLTSGIANVAAARGINLTSVESTVEGDINLLGILGLSDEVRNGYQQIRVNFRLEGDDPERLRSVVEQSQLRSAVYDVAHQRRAREHPRDRLSHGYAFRTALRRGRRRCPAGWSRHRHAPRQGWICGCRWSTAAATAPTRSRPTHCCAAASSSSPGGA